MLDMRTAIFSIFMLVALAASADDAQEAFDNLAVIDNFAWYGPVFLKNKNSDADLRAIGKIAKEEHSREPNPYYPNKETLFTTLHFSDGLEIYFSQDGPGQKPMLIYVRVKSHKWPIKQGLNVGVPVAKVLQVLGNRATKKADSLEYSGETEHVTFVVKDNVVTEVHFDYYTG